jgi:glutathione S-transferase
VPLYSLDVLTRSISLSRSLFPAILFLDLPPSLSGQPTIALNPKGLIPALTHQGRPLHDSHIILEFLEAAYPQYEPRLIPTDPYIAAQARIWVDFINKFIVPGYFRLFHAQTAELQAATLNEWIKYLQCYADQIRGPYFFGEEFSIVDLSIVAWACRDWVLAENRGFKREDVSPKFSAYCQLLTNRPTVLKTFSVRLCFPVLSYHPDLSVTKSTRRITKQFMPST